MEENKDFRHIIRIVNTDLDGNKSISQGLRNIKGVSFMFSNMVCTIASIDPNKKVGYLTDTEVKRIENILKNPSSTGSPIWMLNRRNDYEDGVSKHLLSSDLGFVQDNDIKRMKKIKCYKGVRHILDLPVRGQRTKSNFRKNKGKVHLGVKRKAGAKGGRV
jgi:small subunit ribosomal protein S13